MMQSLTEPHADAVIRGREGGSGARSRRLEPSTDQSSRHGAHRHGLDWSGFRDLYYPASRRHDLEAIVAYGAYQRTSPPARCQRAKPPVRRVVRPQPKRVLQDWEDEGGRPG